jgi:hypothetical protein
MSANYAAGDRAEMAGSAIGINLLNDLMGVRSQRPKAGLIQAAIMNLVKLNKNDRAVTGFAVVLLNVLEVGLENLPKAAD